MALTPEQVQLVIDGMRDTYFTNAYANEDEDVCRYQKNLEYIKAYCDGYGSDDKTVLKAICDNYSMLLSTYWWVLDDIATGKCSALPFLDYYEDLLVAVKGLNVLLQDDDLYRLAFETQPKKIRRRLHKNKEIK